MALRLGIAFYAQKDGRGRPTSPHWALVAHPSSFLAPDIQIFQIRQNGPNDWYLAPHVCALTSAPTLIGVLHISDVPGMTMNQLCSVVSQLPATKNGDDPSGNIVWGCAGWVIRAMDRLAKRGVVRLPNSCGIERVYDLVGRRVQVLKTVVRTPQSPLATIPLFG